MIPQALFSISSNEGDRQKLRRQSRQARHYPADYYLYHRQYHKGIQNAWAMINLDPLSESAHRLLMRLLARDCQRNAALAQYEACREILNETPGVESQPPKAWP